MISGIDLNKTRSLQIEVFVDRMDSGQLQL